MASCKRRSDVVRRIAVIGAAGRTGRHAVEQALARGHKVVAIARTPDNVGVEHDDLVLQSADVRDLDALTGAIGGADAVVSALGTGSSRAPTDVYSRGVANQMTAMREHGTRRLAVISAAPAGPRAEQTFLERRVAMPLLERFFGGIYTDMRRMEALLTEECDDLDWVALRPPRLISKPATGAYRIDTRPLRKARTLTYADLATALLDCLDRPELHRRAAYVAN
jgi:putative NADH-flavin reductase